MQTFHVHGGDTTGYRLQYGKEAIDFSASLNPFGMPTASKKAAILSLEDSCSYPDPYARKLTAALANVLDVGEKQIIWGNGSVDVIYRYVLAIKPRKAMVLAPTFAEYENALKSMHCEVVYFHLQANLQFDIDESILSAIKDDVDVIFLCQPNNPTGRLISPAMLQQMFKRCAQTKTRVFLDECFVPFLKNAGEISCIKQLDRYSHLFLLGSFTKIFGMAGLRIGFGLSADAVLLALMRKCGPPWALSNVAQAAGLAALTQEDYWKKSLLLIDEEKSWLINQLEWLGISIIGSAANYLFFFCSEKNLYEKMADRGIMIRDCQNFIGLSERYYRIAIRQRDENNALVDAMRTALQER